MHLSASVDVVVAETKRRKSSVTAAPLAVMNSFCEGAEAAEETDEKNGAIIGCSCSFDAPCPTFSVRFRDFSTNFIIYQKLNAEERGLEYSLF